MKQPPTRMQAVPPVQDRGGPASGALAFAALALALLLVSPTKPAAADFRSDYMVRLLSTSDSFRVRAQAALALGEMEGSPAVLGALTGALSDAESSVRVAAANSLRQIGDPSALPALRGMNTQGDMVLTRSVRAAIRALEAISPPSEPEPEPDRPAVPARYYVGVGAPGTNLSEVPPEALSAMREFVAERVALIDGVVLAPVNESNDAARRAIQRQRLTGFYIDSTITSIGERNGGMHADVSVILNTYPGRSMRAMLRGGATVVGGRGERAKRQAIEGAIRGALRTLGQVMMATAARPGS